MRRYGGRIEPPLLTLTQDRIYLALTAGSAPGMQHADRHYLAQDLEAVAERLRCDYWAAILKVRGLDACAGYGRDVREAEVHAVAAAVLIRHDAPELRRLRSYGAFVIDSEAAQRLADRLSSLEPVEALRRTLEECEFTPLSRAEVRQLERGADAWQRRLDHLDRQYDHDLGGPEHREAIRAADAELRARGL